MTHTVIDAKGYTLGVYPDLSAARAAAHTTHAHAYTHVVRADGVLMAYRLGASMRHPSVKPPRPVPTPACPVLAALARPRTQREVVASVPWPRMDVLRRLLALCDEGAVAFRYVGGERVWRRVEGAAS